MAKRERIHTESFKTRVREHKALFAVYFALRFSVVVILIAQILKARDRDVALHLQPR